MTLILLVFTGGSMCATGIGLMFGSDTLLLGGFLGTLAGLVATEWWSRSMAKLRERQARAYMHREPDDDWQFPEAWTRAQNPADFYGVAVPSPDESISGDVWQHPDGRRYVLVGGDWIDVRALEGDAR